MHHHMIISPLGDRPQRKMAQVTSEAPLESSATDTWSTLLPETVRSLLSVKKKRGSEMKNKNIACEPEIIDLAGSSTESRFHEVTLTFPLLTYWSQSFYLWLNEKSLSRSDQISHASFFNLINKWLASTSRTECMFTLLTRALWDALTVFHFEMLIQSQRGPSSFTPCRVILLRHALQSVIRI